MSENLGSTQPNIAVKKSGRGRTILFNALGLIVILVIAILAGYGSGISTRRENQSSTISQQLGEQYQFALVDIEFGRYANAKQRLEFIIAHDPAFPGAQQKLTEVLVLSNAPTPTLTPSLTPTPDFSGAEQAFTQAQQQIAAQDWAGAMQTLDLMRKLDSNYQTSQVDGMYYFALRNYGYDLITKQGNLEGGIYHFTLAERFGPLDRDANGLREGARYYLIGASFWELNWEQAIFYFDQVYRGWSGLWDGTSTASQRFFEASMRYGDELTSQERWCDAVTHYQNAQAIGALDATAQANFEDAYVACFPPSPTIDLTALVTPTTDPALITPIATTPPVATTEVPATEAPTEPSATEVPTEPGGG
ncbi:MAG TPA: hypothetical protein VK897_05970 [Anaerolineales bacterium]|nr:hypothetical protein [Anaerolineales bacterium]